MLPEKEARELNLPIPRQLTKKEIEERDRNLEQIKKVHGTTNSRQYDIGKLGIGWKGGSSADLTLRYFLDNEGKLKQDYIKDSKLIDRIKAKESTNPIHRIKRIMDVGEKRGFLKIMNEQVFHGELIYTPL